MALPKWSKDELIDYGNRGYKICPCKSEEEANEIKAVLKENKRCAQAGRTFKDNKESFFVLTKERS